MEHIGDHVSLAFQFLASIFWTIGAILAGPTGASDFLQLFAAVAWFIANLGATWTLLGEGGGSGDQKGGGGDQKCEEKSAPAGVVDMEMV